MVGKKILSMGLLALVLTGTLVGCKEDGQTSSNGEKEYTIGISQLVQHPALDSAREGFVEGLKEKGYEEGKNITLDYQNAQGDNPTSQTIAQKFVSEKNSDVLNIPDFGMVSNNEKVKGVLKDVIYSFCDKFGHWEYNCKNNLVRLK